MSLKDHLRDQKMGSYLEALGSSAPTPGGGAAVALTLAQSCALYMMALRISFRDTDQTLPKTPHEEGPDLTLHQWLEEMGQFQRMFVDLGDQDAAVFGAVMAAYRLPRVTAPEKALRQEEIQSATKRALEVPLAMARLGLKVLKFAKYSVDLSKSKIISDCAIATDLLESGFKGALMNIAINLKVVVDETYGENIRTEVHEMERSVVDACQRMRADCKRVMAGES